MAQIKIVTLDNLKRFWSKIKEKLDAITSKLSALKLSDITDVTATVDEVNYLSGVKSAVQTQIDAKAPLASPNFTGVPTAPTAQAGTKDTTIATTAFVSAAVTKAIEDADLTDALNDYAKTEDVEGMIEAAKPDLSKYFNVPPVYNSSTKKIEFYHDTTKVAELDATPFIKDGMVSEVKIADGKADGDNNGKKVILVTFNTDAGQEDIEIPLEGIFNANNYYDKTTIDGKIELLATQAELADYAKTSEVQEALKPYAKTSEVEGLLKDYVKSEELVAYTNDEIDGIFTA